MGRLGYYSKLSFQALKEVIPKKIFAQRHRRSCEDVTAQRAAFRDSRSSLKLKKLGITQSKGQVLQRSHGLFVFLTLNHFQGRLMNAVNR